MVKKTEWLNREAADQQQVGRAMTDITIPPAALEAAAEDLFHIQYDDSKGSWSDAPEWLKVTIRSEARAALLAGLKAWPGAKHVTEYYLDTGDYFKPSIILPLTEKQNAEG